MRNKIFITFLSFVLIFCLTGCSFDIKTDEKNTVGDIAYNVTQKGDHKVYLQEGSEYVPYLVLTNNYNNENVCLLLREHVLENSLSYNHRTKSAIYYKDSEIDKFLSEDFYVSFSEKDKSLMINCSVPITIQRENSKISQENSIESIKITTIRRKIFLLSYAELNGNSYNAIPMEGHALEYFDNPQKKIATNSENNKMSWWLRTPNFVDKNCVSIVTQDGILSSISIYEKTELHTDSIRPAIAVSPETKIRKTIISDKNVYVLSK